MMTTRTLQRCLAYYGKLCEVPVTAHRLRHTFACQMLAVGKPVTSLLRFLGHEHLETTMIYAEVADTVLQQEHFRGISALDPISENLPIHNLATSLHRNTPAIGKRTQKTGFSANSS